MEDFFGEMVLFSLKSCPVFTPIFFLIGKMFFLLSLYSKVFHSYSSNVLS